MSEQPLAAAEPGNLTWYLHAASPPCRGQAVLPPMLHFGWTFSEEKILQVLGHKFPTYVRKLGGTEQQLRYIDEADCKVPSPLVPVFVFNNSALPSLFASALIYKVRRCVKVRKEIAGLVEFRVVRDKDNKAQYAITVGNNYHGVVNRAVRRRLCQALELEEQEAKWHLDPIRWFWRKRGRPSSEL